MPISKRNKLVDLSKTKKQGMGRKMKLHAEVLASVDKYENIFVFFVSDMRNSKMKSVREQWRHSRFFFGKNKVMARALGRSREEEYQPNLHKVAEMLRGPCGLLLTNKSVEEVLRWFGSFSEMVYARSGNIATEDVMLREGPLSQFPHSLEPELRRLGLPTTLTKGIVHLIKDHEVCKKGDILTPEAAKLLEHLEYQMAEFSIKFQCVWSRDGSFMDLRTEIPDEGSTKKKKSIPKSKKRRSRSKSCSGAERMEIDEDENLATGLENSTDKLKTVLAFEDSPKNKEAKKEKSPKNNVENGNFATEVGNSADELKTLLASEDSSKKKEAKKEKSPKNNVENGNFATEVGNSADELKTVLAFEDSPKNKEAKKEKSPKNNVENGNFATEVGNSTDELKTEDIPKSTNQKKEESPRNKVVEEVEMEIVKQNGAVEAVRNNTTSIGSEMKLLKQNCSTPRENVEFVCNTEEVQQSVQDKSFIYARSPEKTQKKEIQMVEDEISSRQSRSRKRPQVAAPKEESFKKDTSIANSSQESPVFRELRNRSVRFSRKKNKK